MAHIIRGPHLQQLEGQSPLASLLTGAYAAGDASRHGKCKAEAPKQLMTSGLGSSPNSSQSCCQWQAFSQESRAELHITRSCWTSREARPRSRSTAEFPIPSTPKQPCSCLPGILTAPQRTAEAHVVRLYLAMSVSRSSTLALTSWLRARRCQASRQAPLSAVVQLKTSTCRDLGTSDPRRHVGLGKQPSPPGGLTSTPIGWLAHRRSGQCSYQLHLTSCSSHAQGQRHDRHACVGVKPVPTDP